MAEVHLAQLNIGTLVAPVGSAEVAEFVDALDEINALGERSPGFVWRLVGEGNDATDLRPFPGTDVIVNMTVWESRDSLFDFTYRTRHASLLGRRREWFTALDGPSVVLWNVPAGHRPTLGEARARLDHLGRYGASPYAFGFRDRFEPVTLARASVLDPVSLELIEELNADLLRRHDGGNHFRLDPHEVAEGRGGFFVLRVGAEPVGCGAIRLIDSSTAEVKRMWVRTTHRGRRYGTAILSHLHGATRDLGATVMVLETSAAQPEALALYRRFGFAEVPCWGEYLATPDTSICLAHGLPV